MCSPIEFVDRIKKYDGFRETFREACENVKNNEPKKLVQCQWIIKTSETFVDLIKSDAGEVGYITSDKFVKLKNQGVPLFIISGEKDLASLKFFDNIKKQDVLVERTIIADTSHNFTGKENELAQELTKAFLKLKSPHTKFVPLKKGLEN